MGLELMNYSLCDYSLCDVRLLAKKAFVADIYYVVFCKNIEYRSMNKYLMECNWALLR